MDKVRFGVVGLGNMGSGHTRNLFEGKIPGAVLTAVCDIKPERLDWARSVCGDSVQYFADSHELITSGLVDAVMIATPHYFHPIIGTDAFENGLNVLSEKPIGVFTKSIYPFMEAAKKSGKTFGIMYNQRTNKLYQKMREMVKDGSLGELKRCVWIITDWYRTQAYYNSGGWRATWAGEGGGVMLNQCPHQLDLWQWICGMPTKIRATCHEGKWHDIEVEDDVTIYAEYSNDATGTFITTTGDCPGTNRLEITLDKAKIICENDPFENKFVIKMYVLDIPTSEFCKTAKDGFAKAPGKWVNVETDGQNDQHPGVLNAFAAHILRNEPLIAEGAEGINGLTISNAAFMSSWLKKDIDIPFDENLYWELLQKKIAGSKKKDNVVESVQADMSHTY